MSRIIGQIFADETFFLGADVTGKTHSTSNQKHSGMLQLVWKNCDSATGIFSLEISNDNRTWSPWVGLDTSDLVGVSSINTTVGDDNQIWEVKKWTSRYFRFSYTANSATVGTCELFIHYGTY
jgi:hypothetical protein